MDDWIQSLTPEHKATLGMVGKLVMLIFADDEEKADDWLNNPYHLLENQVPAQLMRTPDGAAQVKDLLCIVRAMQEMGKLPCPVDYTIKGRPS